VLFRSIRELEKSGFYEIRVSDGSIFVAEQVAASDVQEALQSTSTEIRALAQGRMAKLQQQSRTSLSFRKHFLFANYSPANR